VLLRLSEISKSYPLRGGRRLALDHASLNVERGKMVGVFGPSGAGKTTLLRIAAGLQMPDSGIVTYNGECLDEMPTAERRRFWRREVSCIWSGEELQERLSVLDHVSLPLLIDGRHRRAAERRAREALLACEAENCLGMEVQELSDGERQRVDIARALVSEPRLLIADAPASRLSIIEQETIMALFSSLAHDGKVGVLVTHSDAEVLLRADSTFYLRDGKILDPREGREPGKLLHLPTAGSRRRAAGADA
jgi:ABC-type lipoprotein export system ATPase subunit